MADLDHLPLGARVALAVAVGAALWGAAWRFGFHQRAATLVVYNAHDAPLQAWVGEWSGTVPPRGQARLDGVASGVLSVEVRAEDGRVVDGGQVSFEAHPGGVAVLNLNGRGLLARRTVRYVADDAVPRPAAPPPPTLLDPRRLLDASEADFVLERLPASRDFDPGARYADAVVVEDLGLELPLSDQVGLLIDHGLADAAPDLVRAELEVDPDDVEALSLAPRVLDLSGEAGLAFAADLRERAPTSVEVHRFYQDVAGPARGGALIEEYAARAAAHPDDAAAVYLHARLLPTDHPAAAAGFARAADLDPALAPARLALGQLALLSGDAATAEPHLAAYAASGRAAADAALDGRLRAARLAGAPAWGAETQGLLAQAHASGVSAYRLLSLEALLRAADPAEPLAPLLALGAGVTFEPAGEAPTGPGVEARWSRAFARGDEQAARSALDALPAAPELAPARLLQALADGDPVATDARITADAAALRAGGVHTALLAAAWATARGLPQAAELRAAASAPGGSGSPQWVLEGGDPRADPRWATVVPSLRPIGLWAAALMADGRGDAALAAELRARARAWALPAELPPPP